MFGHPGRLPFGEDTSWFTGHNYRMQDMRNARYLIDKLNVRSSLNKELKNPSPAVNLVHSGQEVLVYRKNMGESKWAWIRGHAVKVLGKTVLIKRKNRIYPTSKHRVRHLPKSRERKKESLDYYSTKTFEEKLPSSSASHPFSCGSLDNDSASSTREVLKIQTHYDYDNPRWDTPKQKEVA